MNTSAVYTVRRINAREAFEMGLADVCVEADQVRQAAVELGTEIATSAPIAVMSTRATLRAGLADALVAAADREVAEQERHFQTADFTEGLAEQGVLALIKRLLWVRSRSSVGESK